MAEAPRKSYYDVLGVPAEADIKDIKDAYRRAARASHPDLGGSAAQFHDVAVAYETLSDPQRRERYDAETGRGRPTAGGSARNTAAGSAAGGPGRPGSAGTTRTSVEDEDAAKSPPVYLPPFSPSNPPTVPLILAGRHVHGEPRQPGMFARLSSGVRSRVDGELRTSNLIERALLPSYPAARLVNGVQFDDRNRTSAGHVLLAGYRMAVIDSFTGPPGNFSWDGRSLRHQGRPVDLRLPTTLRAVQELFPECNVAGWVVIHGAPDNPFAPVIDVPPGFDRTSPTVTQVVNAGTAVRTIRSFLSSGPSPNVVQLPVLARLLTSAGS
ncbi:J domain-containing protein [Arthrobacter sp. NamB2]|uniref:J domain-containing protein n=1 Tax=Arthrobacter sp. NamB2 TaxID=2576035 RepID=UPI0010C9AB61|nr:J domain-containing protein [Arthrobacter sp. NamB2]TKV29676.1 J domain-containing protein [Arthrobacter sp. NamB2]